MNIKLNKALVVFDLETTGIQIATDRIVEIYCIKIQPDGSEDHLHQVLNPTVPIPLEVSKIHGIWDKDVIGKPTFQEFAKELNAFLGDCDFGGFNSNRFDFPLLAEEFYRADVSFNTTRKFIDAQRIFHKMEPRNLGAAYQKYCGKELIDAHSAKADTVATWEIIKAQVDHYDELEGNIDFLNAFSGESEFFDFARRIKRGENNEAYFNFGKYKGQKVVNVFKENRGYYDWMMKGDFPENTKSVITKLALESRNT
ncbi:MAG: DNA polymerase III subunit epsilon [Bacteroidetes bacterium]|nr:MAG: DNA polymerase III subunit epsilon [Bacteroidota bacterium]